MHPEFYPINNLLTMSITSFFKLLLLSAVCLGSVAGFVQTTASFASPSRSHTIKKFAGQASSSSTQLWALDDEDVNVNLIPDVDAATLTAVGFGLIAFNFLVVANLGDGGIAGFLATIINTLNQ